MNIVYEDSIMRQVERVVHDSLVADKLIDRIELTVEESRKLNEELNSIGWDSAPRSITRPFTGEQMFGVKIFST